jgi:phosphatidylglycerol:prolipoprotein diacylglycerol transferase
MHPDFIHVQTVVGMMDISAFTGLVWTAILVAGYGMFRCLRVHHVPRRSSIVFAVGILGIAVVGARLFHILTTWSDYERYPAAMYTWDTQGLSLFGALLSAGLTAPWVGKLMHIPVWAIADDMVPFLGIGIAVARIGCFLEGCCFGKATTVPWGVRFPILSEAHLSQIAHGQTTLLTVLPVHPTQLYEAFGALVSIGFALWVHKKLPVHGSGIVTFIGCFSFVRLIVQEFRVFPDSFIATSRYFPAVYIGICCYCALHVLVLMHVSRRSLTRGRT